MGLWCAPKAWRAEREAGITQAKDGAGGELSQWICGGSNGSSCDSTNAASMDALHLKEQTRASSIECKPPLSLQAYRVTKVGERCDGERATLQ